MPKKPQRKLGLFFVHNLEGWLQISFLQVHVQLYAPLHGPTKSSYAHRMPYAPATMQLAMYKLFIRC
jgi:hypothetical protein